MEMCRVGSIRIPRSFPPRLSDPEINYTLERYGNRSACFEHSAPWRLRRCSVDHTVEHWGSGCYKVRAQRFRSAVPWARHALRL